MKIVIATSVAPLVEGGSTYIVDWLAQELENRGHQVEVLRLPFEESYTESLGQLLALRLLDVSQHGDRLIAIRTPSHLLQHPNKVVWFIHHYRGAYDLWGTEYQTIPNTPEGIAYRQAIVAADNLGLREAQRVFCNSAVVRERVKKFNGIDSTVLYPPLQAPEQFRCEEPEGYILYFGRLTRHKRQWLAIESMQHTNSAARLIVAGAPDPGVDLYVQELKGLIVRHGLGERVTLLPRWISQSEKIDLFARALAVAYFPFDEDSYGYPSLEAHAAGKPVLTTTDSGGTLELVVDGRNGLVTLPQPEAIAAGIDMLFESRSLSKELGKNGARRVADLAIHWDHVVHELLR